MGIENLSIAEARKLGLEKLGHFGAVFDSFLNKYLIENYEDFIVELYKDLDEIFKTMQLNRELRQKDAEDRITIEIVNLLLQKGYTASHDKKSGGHVDVTVELHGFTWFGEAKKHGAYEHLLEGFKQLCTRYSTGEKEQNNGGLLIYIFGSNVDSVMKEWKFRLSEEGLPSFRVINCMNRPPSFVSTHIHDVSGGDFSVRHMPMMLYFKPQDKSGISRKG